MNHVTLVAALLITRIAQAANFTVSNTDNSGPGSLRQALLDNEKTNGPNVIEFAITGSTPFVIKPEKDFLPPLKGPVVLRVRSAPVEASGGRGRGGAVSAVRSLTEIAPVIVLDGSNLVKPRTPADCPGATFHWNSTTDQWEKSAESGVGPNVRGYYGPGLAVQDSHDVEISGVEIRNFCAGIATVRSSNVFIHDVKITGSQGAAGVIFTGDDGKSGRTELSFNNRLVNSLLLDNGDGFEFTRGTHDSLLQNNYIGLTQALPENGNAVEFATSGDRNAVIGNTFTRYSDTAVTIGGQGHTVRDNRFVSNRSGGLRATGSNLLIFGNTFTDNSGSAITIGGVGTRVLDNLITGNEGTGISVTSPGVSLSRNSIFNNSGAGIEIGSSTARGGGRGVAAPDPSAIPNPPAFDSTSTWTNDTIRLTGMFNGKQNQSYQIEVFASRAANKHAADGAEGQKFIGIAAAVTDATGKASFVLPLPLDDLFGNGESTAWFTATATDAAGSTSKFSRALVLSKSATNAR